MEETLQGGGEGLPFTHSEMNINISCNSLITLHFMSVTHECFTHGEQNLVENVMAVSE